MKKGSKTNLNSFKDSTFYQKIDWIGLNFVISSKSNEPIVFISACMLCMNLYSFKHTQSSEIAHNEIIDMYVFSNPDTLIIQLLVMSQSSHILRKELFLAFFHSVVLFFPLLQLIQ